MTDLSLDLNQSLEMRISQFKNDPEKMREVNEFLSEVFEKAQKEADKRNGKQKGKLMEQEKSRHGPFGLSRLRALLQPESLPRYAIVPIRYGLLLLLATIIIRKYLPSHNTTNS